MTSAQGTTRVQTVARDVLDLHDTRLSEGQAVSRTGLSRLEVRDLETVAASLLAALQAEAAEEKQVELRNVVRVLLGWEAELQLKAKLGYATGDA